MSYHMNGTGPLGGYNKCVPNVQNLQNLDTKAGREAAAKAVAACSADTACATYGVPPGVCGAVADKLAGVLIDVWNGVFGDDAHDRAVLMAQMESAVASAQLHKLDWKFKAYYFNAAARLIDLNDKLLPGQKGAFGGGASSVVTLAAKSGYIAVGNYSFPYKHYARNAPAMKKLVALGAPGGWPTGPTYDTWVSPPSLMDIDYKWRQANGGAGAIAWLAELKSLIKTYSEWMPALAVAEASALAEIEAKAVLRKPIYLSMSTTSPSSPIVTTVVVAGAAGLLWWAGKKFLF